MNSIYKKLSLTSVLMLSIVALGACSPKGDEANNENHKDKVEEVAKVKYKYVTEDGKFTIGKDGVIPVADIKEDTPTVIIYSDPLCPACSIYDKEAFPYLMDQVNEGNINLQNVPLMFLDNNSVDKYSSRASAYLLGVAEYAPEIASKFIPVLMENQPSEGDGEPTHTQDDFNEMFKSVGGNEEQISKINEVMGQNMDIVYKSTMQTVNSNEIIKLSPTGSLYTPFVVPQKSDGKKLKAIDLVEGQLLSNTEAAVKEITK